MISVEYISVLDFFDLNPPIEVFEFEIGSQIGNTSPSKTLKTTDSGIAALDGYVALLSQFHDNNHRFGGIFDVNDMFVSKEDPLSVKITKEPAVEASRWNIFKDYDQLVNLLLSMYGTNDMKPAYVDDFINRLSKLRHVKSQRWESCYWIVRNHPLLIESAKRRLFLEDFYKFTKTLEPALRTRFFNLIDRKISRQWHLLIIPHDDFLIRVYWKGREDRCPEDYPVCGNPCPILSSETEKIEDPDVYRYTSQDGYLAQLLRQLIVHGSEDAAVRY